MNEHWKISKRKVKRENQLHTEDKKVSKERKIFRTTKEEKACFRKVYILRDAI